MKTAILGGGLTGIALARMLNEHGEDVTVFEKEDKTGGLCRSNTEDGFTFDTGGSHIIFSRDKEVNDFMCDVLGENKDKRNRNTKIFFKGRYVKYPFENGLYQLPPEDRFFCINEFVKNLIALEKGELKEPENFKEWIYHTFGKGIAESYMVPYNEKIWNFPADKMSMHWVDGRIPRPPVEDIIKSAIGIETEGYTHQSVFTYPVYGGIEALTDALKEPVSGRIITGFPVTSVKRTDRGFLVGNGKDEYLFDKVISTLPPETLIKCLQNVPQNVSGACTNLKYNSIACVGIGVKGSLNDISWLYIPQKEPGKFNRISFPSNYSTEVAPKGCSSVLAEITYNEGDEVSKMSDQDLIRHVTGGLEDMGIINENNEVVYSRVFRFEYAYVVYDLDYLINVRIMKDYVNSEGIDLVGRFSEFEYINMDGCIRHVLDYVKKNFPDAR
ncbi:protoporphyrinogen oxidase [Methanomicrobium sp. W14]|uniref:protoporphyrinogen/coproporphyrinogen oxidase n=1 Tax=Methanomicrobium sp. W14 TaxID=2817839 RepID=UPI001AE8E5C7|nr:protoporphyrinogen oxidase [Methanomicrobium sp. W14]